MHSNKRNSDLARNFDRNGFLAGFACFSRHKLEYMHELRETEWQCYKCAGSQPDCGRACVPSFRKIGKGICNAV